MGTQTLTGQVPRGDDAEPTPTELVVAIGHEVGNHLGGIRLQAHFLDGDLEAFALARASVEIDQLAGRAGALLALLRPVLASNEGEATVGPAPTPPTRWGALTQGLRQSLEDEGTRGVKVTIEAPKTPDLESLGVDGMHAVVAALAGATLERLCTGESLHISVEERASEAVLVFADQGAGDDLPGRGGLQGRSLVLAIARQLLARAGGRVEVSGHGERTEVALVIPTPSGV